MDEVGTGGPVAEAPSSQYKGVGTGWHMLTNCQSDMNALSMCLHGLLHHHGQARGSSGFFAQRLCSTACDHADMPFDPLLHQC